MQVRFGIENEGDQNLLILHTIQFVVEEVVVNQSNGLDGDALNIVYIIKCTCTINVASSIGWCIRVDIVGA